MIIVKDVPGLTAKEVFEALIDIAEETGSTVTSGYGGAIVDEETAEKFLIAYLIASGKRRATPVVSRTPVKRASRKKVTPNDPVR